VERRIVSIETQLRDQKQQQAQMNDKLNSIDGVAMESNQLIKRLIADMQISSTSKGSKRDKPSDDHTEADPDVLMTSMASNP